MNALVFSACQILGLALITAGVALRFSLPWGLITCGVGMIVLTLITVKVAGRR